MQTIQQEYLKKLVNATETYIKKLEEEELFEREDSDAIYPTDDSEFIIQLA